MSFILNIDKQQDYDLPSLVEETLASERSPQIRSRSPRSTNAPPPMSTIAGFNKKPLMHTNSFTSDRLPSHGVETPHEAQLGQALSEMNNWGIDIFKIGLLSMNRPLTCVSYWIFCVSVIDLLIKKCYVLSVYK